MAPLRVAVAATLSCLVVLLAGCGGNPGPAPTPGPTPAPTPPTTPAPTPAPTPGPTVWKEACVWTQANTTLEMDAGCDDVDKQLVTNSISTSRDGPITLGSLEPCSKAIESFTGGTCAGQKITHQNDTSVTCMKALQNDAVLTETVTCYADRKVKYYYFVTTTPSRSAYGPGKGCQFMVDNWKNGQEVAHPGSCHTITPVTTTTTTVGNSTFAVV